MKNCIVDSKKMMEALQSPFELKHIEWRVQLAIKGNNGNRVLVIPYITSRTIMNRLDEVFGGYWQTHYDKISISGVEAFQCRLSLKIGDEWITRTDAAEVSDNHSIKGGHSNALKRVGVQWGIGRYLYELEPFWVDVKERGKHRVDGNFKVNGQQSHIRGYFDSPKLPTWALPAGKHTSQNENSNTAPLQQPSQRQDKQAQQPVQVRTPAEEHASAVALVSNLLNHLQVPEGNIANLLLEASGVSVHYTQASTEDLGKLYHALSPVRTYLADCRKYGLDEERMLFYAQIVLKVRVEDVSSLFFKLTKETCNQTLELIRDDLKDSQVG